MRTGRRAVPSQFLYQLIFSATVCCVLMLSAIDVAPAVLRNVVWQSILSQLTQRQWAARGVGLRQTDVDKVALTLYQPTSLIWTSMSQLGLAPFVGEQFITYLPVCDNYNLRAQRLLYEERWIEAQIVLKSLLDRCPERHWINLQLGLVYDRMDQPLLAIQSLEQGGISRYGLELAAANYLELASECSSDRPSTECTDWFDRIHSLMPNHLYLLQWLSGFTMQFDPETVALWHEPRLNHFVALAAIKRLKQTNESWSNLLFPLAKRLSWNGNMDSTLLLYTAARESEPENFFAHYFAGLAATSMGNWHLAKTALDDALRLRPQSINVQLALARTYVHLNSFDQAKHYYHSALEKVPCIPEALEYLSQQSSTDISLLQQVSKCKASLNRVLEAESLPGWGTVVFDKNASGQQTRHGSGNFIIYGSSLSFPSGRYQATFYLRIPDVLRSQCVRLDAFDDANQTDGAWLMGLAQRWIEPDERVGSGYNPFSVEFVSPQGGEFQFRVLELCGNDVFVDRVEIHPL